MPVRVLALACAAALLGAGPRAQTCTTSWTSPTGGLWESPGNWSDGVPGTSDTACITLAGTYTVDATAGNHAVAGLVVGGASGTQTLTVRFAFRVGAAGDASAVAMIGANGRVELVGGTGPTPTRLRTQGTIAVAGALVLGASTAALDEAGGLIDVAPGGTLRLDTPSSTPPVVGPVSGAATVRVRGMLDCAAGASTCNVDARLNVDGGTVRATSGRLVIGNRGAGGDWHDATVDAAAGATVEFRGWQGTPFRVTGTLSGAPAGTVVNADARIEAGPGDATLAVGGTGFQNDGPAGGAAAILASGGGRFINTGRLVWGTGATYADAVVIENRGLTEVAGGGMQLRDGTRFLNRAGATLALSGQVIGLLENAGLVAVVSGQVRFLTQDSRNGLVQMPGGELRVLDPGQASLLAPVAQSFPAGATASGTGRVLVPLGYEHQGTVSPGTADAPVGTLTWLGHFVPSRLTGSPRLVVDVDAGGLSDRVAVQPGAGSDVVRLAGLLVVRVRPGVTPQIGDAWTVLSHNATSVPITGQFAAVVAEGAPSGIAFVTELSADQRAVVVRAVAVAPGGPVTVSTTTPIGGGVRPIFLSGPGAPGVSAARLQCTECLDADSLGTIPAQIVGAGTAVVEARFDLTSPRAFGLYDLVVQRPGQPDLVTPVTVRPFVSYIQVLPTVNRGIRVRPATGPGGGGYNWSHYDVWNVSNVEAPAYTFLAAGRQDSSLVAFAVASGNPFGSAVMVYESEAAPDPTADALLFARVTPRAAVPLTVGQRMGPSDVLFPEQTPTGPDDPRIPFGALRLLTAVGVQHTTFERARVVVEGALRTTGHAPLDAYLAAVDAASSGAVRAAVEEALLAETRYVGGTDALLARVLAEANPTVPTPAGLAESAAAPFDAALDRWAGWHYRDLDEAYSVDLATAPESVQAIFRAEYDALVDPASFGPDERAGLLGSVCRNLPPTVNPAANSALNNQIRRTTAELGQAVCRAAPAIRGLAPAGPPPGPPPVPSDLVRRTARSVARTARTVARSTATVAGGLRGGTCDPGGGDGAGAGAGGACGPPAAPADPNDKTTDAAMLCETGTVIVDAQPVTRCVRYFVPLADAAEPIPYTIQFENLPQATANAEFVTITDVLDADLDPASLEVYGTSADSTFSYSVSGQTVTFRFVGIDLPPNVDEPEGQGYVAFGVRPRPGLPTGTVIENTASIVFDFNPPIATPTVTHEIRQTADVSTTILAPDEATQGQPLAFEAVVANLTGDPADDVTVTLSAGSLALTAAPSAGTCSGSAPVVCQFGTLAAGELVTVALSSAAPSLGSYTLRSAASTSAFDGFLPNNTEEVSLNVVIVNGEDGPGALTEPRLAAPSPNPARGSVALRFGSPAAGRADVRVFDLLGREVAVVADDAPAEAGWHETTWDARRVASGVYVVRYVTAWAGGTTVRTRRVVVVR